ncbi:MAG TPA: nitronate monooxygenase [Actinomycetota bacterium]|nr:nitronate monooxygenase [Actinomycetota bacterium]
MLRTRLCELLGIEIPVIQGPLGGPWEVSGNLVAAVSNAGGLGSIATTLRRPGQVRDSIAEVRDRTDRPFAVNHTRRPFDEDVFQAILDARPPVISFALGDPGDCVNRAHDAGAKFMLQVTTVAQARVAVEAGVDVIIAQGAEAGGFSGSVGTISLVPQVVDVAGNIPVVAAGGIADGRGLAAALVLGAAGVNIGTRFLASSEAAVDEGWKQQIVSSESEDAVKIGFADHIVPPLTEGGWPTIPRSLRTGFIDTWNARPADVPANAEGLRGELTEAMRSGRAHELIPLSGQTAGQIHRVLPVEQIMREIAKQAETTLATRSF